LHSLDLAIIQADLAEVDGRAFGHVDLFAAGLPCPPFSIAGKQLGQHDERDLLPHALRLAEQVSPRAVVLENVPGLAARRFDGYGAQILRRLHGLGYQTWWQLAQASQHGVPQLRVRFVLVAIFSTTPIIAGSKPSTSWNLMPSASRLRPANPSSQSSALG
jgi:DNA (cytosine-5)-methyltransferase 1